MVPPPSLFHSLLRPAILQTLRATGFHAAKPAVLDALTELAARYLAALCAATARHATHHEGGVGVDTVGVPTVVDVRMALEDVGALGPERAAEDTRRWVQVRRPRRRRRRASKDRGAMDDEMDVDAFGREGGINGVGREDGSGSDEDSDHNGGDDDEFEWEVVEDEDTRGLDEFLAWITGPRNKEIKRVALGGEEDITDYLSGKWPKCQTCRLASDTSQLTPPTSAQKEAQQDRRGLKVPRHRARKGE